MSAIYSLTRPLFNPFPEEEMLKGRKKGQEEDWKMVNLKSEWGHVKKKKGKEERIEVKTRQTGKEERGKNIIMPLAI